MERGRQNLFDLFSQGIDFLTVVVSKDEIDRKDISVVNSILEQLITDVRLARFFRERVELSFDGYNDSRQELWEITEIRNFVLELDNIFPFWLYFLSKNGSGLYVILKCFLLPFIIPEAETEVNGPRLQKYLENRGLPALNQICMWADIPEIENEKMTQRLVDYIQKK